MRRMDLCKFVSSVSIFLGESVLEGEKVGPNSSKRVSFELKLTSPTIDARVLLLKILLNYQLPYSCYPYCCHLFDLQANNI